MPVLVDWYNQSETIKHWQFIDPWLPQHYHDIVADEAAISAAKPHKIATIMDFTAAYNSKSHALKLLRIGGKTTPSNLDIVIFVGGSFVANMVSMYQRVNPRIHYVVHTCPTLKEALACIADHRRKDKAS